MAFLREWAEISPTDTVFDIACGTGEFERLILSENPAQQMVGVDISEKMLVIAHQKFQVCTNISFYTAPASELPFADHSFDMAISANSFHYFDDPDAVLREMRRVLKPDGKGIILDWCKDYLLCRICDVVLKLFNPAYQ